MTGISRLIWPYEPLQNSTMPRALFHKAERNGQGQGNNCAIVIKSHHRCQGCRIKVTWVIITKNVGNKKCDIENPWHKLNLPAVQSKTDMWATTHRSVMDEADDFAVSVLGDVRQKSPILPWLRLLASHFSFSFLKCHCLSLLTLFLISENQSQTKALRAVSLKRVIGLGVDATWRRAQQNLH